MDNYKFRRITQPGKAKLLGFACTLIYAVSYIGRLNYSAALPYLLKTGLITKPQGGIISTAYFFAYGAGQLINGIAADRTEPQSQVLLGICGAALMNFIMTLAGSFPLMLLLWTLNGFFQSMIWAPALLLLATSVPEKQRSTQLWLLNTSPAFGAVASYVFSGSLLVHFPWQGLFNGAAVVMFAGAAVFYFCSRSALEGAVYQENSSEEMVVSEPIGSSARFLPLLLSSGGLLLIFPVMIHGMLKDGTANWIPTYMSEVFSLSAGLAVMMSVVPQIANLLAATVAFWLKKHVKYEITEAIILFCIAGGSLLFMFLFGKLSAFVTIVLFALVTMSMQAVNVVFVSQMPTHFARYGRMASVSGFFNSVAYIGCAISTYLIALISEYFGWNVTIIIWLISSGVSVVLCLGAIPAWKNFLEGKRRQD